jgi:hypothetical protein
MELQTVALSELQCIGGGWGWGNVIGGAVGALAGGVSGGLNAGIGGAAIGAVGGAISGFEHPEQADQSAPTNSTAGRDWA